jgi:hypothetical protein
MNSSGSDMRSATFPGIIKKQDEWGKTPTHLFFDILIPSPADISTKKSLACSESRSMPEAEGQG